MRKKPKARNEPTHRGSPIGDGDRCLVVEDAITTGGSLLKAVDAVEATGAKVVAVSTLVDRGNSETTHRK